MTSLVQDRMNIARVEENVTPQRAWTPAHTVDVSRRVKPWRWTSVLLAPVEVLALAWSAAVVILLIMVPVGLALAGALWFVRLILSRL